MKTNSVKRLTISALLIAMGIIIPMVMPRITIGPASFTLASHVPVFIAMFISPVVAIAVSLGTGLVFLSATPIIALRALSHLIFAVIGAVILQKHPEILINKEGKFTLLNGKLQLFNVGIGVIHSAAELVVVSVFYTMGNLPGTYYTAGFMYSIFLLMGVGGLIHSLVDFSIAYFLASTLSKHVDIPTFTEAKQPKVIKKKVKLA